MWVGLTGLMGSGKSTVAKLFGQYNDVELHITDILAKKSINTKNGQDFIKDRFGEQYIVNGGVDFSALGKLVFANEQDLRDLEAYSHPIVIDWVKTNYKKNKINIVENAVLFECGMDEWMDVIIYVICHPDIQKERLYDRGMTDEDINNRLKFQMAISSSTKIQKSNYRIDNSFGMDILEQAVQSIMGELMGQWQKQNINSA